MAVFTIAGLTLKEAVRRRTLFGALLMGLLVLGLSLILIPVRHQQDHLFAIGRLRPNQYAFRVIGSRSFLMSLCLSSIKSLGALFAALLAGGAISGEIEQGVLAVILPKPIPRWQILAGKWLGINLILIGSTLVWTLIAWTSFDAQVDINVSGIWKAAPYLMLFPVLLSTLTLTISTVAPRLFGTTAALTLAAFAWFDGIFNFFGTQYDVALLRGLADFAGLVVPQGYAGWWVEHATEDIIERIPAQNLGWTSPEFLRTWGAAHLHIAHLDAVYVTVYIVLVFLLGAALFQRRDI